MNPLISVIVPVYNREKYIEKCIRSITEQSYRNLEIIIVNDGSTDGSLKLLKDIAASDGRLRVIEQKNGGPSKARNNGIREARGEWIYFMDSDDILEENALKEMTEDCAISDLIVFGLIRHICSENGEKKKQYPVSLPDAHIKSEEELKRYLEKVARDKNRDVFFSYIWNKLIRTDVIRENSLQFNESLRLGEDFVFITEVLKRVKRVRVIERPYYHYFVRGTASLVGRFYRDELERRKQMYGAMTGLYKYHGLYEKCRDTLEVNEGRTSLISMGKINYPSCGLNEREKIRYVNGFLQDERRDFMAGYLKGQGGKKNFVKRMLIRGKMALPLYWMIKR